MSYIQIEIGGKLRGIKFSQGTTILLQDSPVMDMDEAERKAFGVQYIIWAGLKTNCAIKGERLTKTVEVDGKPTEVKVTTEDVFEWVEKLTPEVITEVVDLYAEVNAFKEKLPQPVEDGEKKSSLTIIEPIATELQGD